MAGVPALFPMSGCPYARPNLHAERYPPLERRAEWSLILDEFRVTRDYGVLREQGTVEHILFYTVSGGGFVVTPNGWESAGPGKCIIIDSGIPHYYATTPGVRHWHFYWAHFFPHSAGLNLLGLHGGQGGLLVATAKGRKERGEIERALREARALRRQAPVGLAEKLALNALDRALLWLAVGHFAEGGRDPRLQRCLDHILTHPEQSHDIPALARRSGLSVSRFSHLFREHIGESPQRFVEAVRLDLAMEWLRTGGRSLTEIADGLGFSSSYYLSRRFKARFGKSPDHFRQRKRKSC